MTTIEIDDLTAKALSDLAKSQGLTVADYLRAIANVTKASKSNGSTDEFDFDAELDALVFDGPGLPPDFSRADIYSDHD